MDNAHRALLKHCWLVFFQDLEPNVLLPHLVKVLIDGDEELVKGPKTRRERVNVLLDILQRRGPDAFKCFLEALKEVQPHLAKLLQQEEGLMTERVSSANLREKLSETQEQLNREQLKNSDIQKDYADLKRIHEEELKQLQELRDAEIRNIEEIAKLRKNFSELQCRCDQLVHELERWRSLPGRVFNFKKEFDSNGVMYTLGTNFNTTPFTNPASNNNCSIIVTRSSHVHGHPMDLLELRKGTLSCTRDEENSWWQVDLGEDYTLFATHYTLRHGRDNGLSVIRNWNLEGSRDGRNWKILRKHENDRALKEPFPFFTGTWAVEGKIEAMRYFRIHQTGKNSSGRYALCLSGFEIYGILLFMKG